jgi:hypothetical protein
MEHVRFGGRQVTGFSPTIPVMRRMIGFGISDQFGLSATQKLADLGPYGKGAYPWKPEQGTEFVLGTDYVPADAPSGSTITSLQSTTVLTKQPDGTWIGKDPHGVVQGNPWPAGQLEAQQFSAVCKDGKMITVQSTGDMWCIPPDGLNLTNDQGDKIATILQNGDTVLSNGNTVHADGTVTLSTAQETENTLKAIVTVVLHPIAAAKLGAIGMLNPNALDDKYGGDDGGKYGGDKHNPSFPWWAGPAAGAAGVLLLIVILKK